MLRYDVQGSHEEAHLYASREEMESLVLDEPPNGSCRSSSDPLSSSLPYPKISTEDDPLLSSTLPSFVNPHAQSQYPSTPFTSILEPPSYADAVFRSFDGDNYGVEIDGRNSSIGSPSVSSSASTSEYLRISVSDPQKEQELSNSLVPGGNTYFTYLITTRTNLPEFRGTEFSVRRRFKEVVVLSDRLSEAYKGFFIPIRPDKNVVEGQMMQRPEFVEQRRVALEKYLGKLAAHPVIKKSEELRLFLQAQDKFFGETTGAACSDEVPQQAKGGMDLLRIFKEFKQSVANDWGGTKPPLVEEDNEFLEKKDKLHDFEQQLSNVSKQAESLVKAQQEIAETMGQLGLAFVNLTKFESEEAVYDSQRVRAADMKNVAAAAVKASRLYRELNSQTVKHLEKLHEYLGIILAVNNAFSDRSNALLTVQTLLSELSSLNSRIERLDAASSKIFGGDRSRIQKIEELKETQRVTEDAKNCALREYERIKENNKNELQRLEKEKQDDFLGMLKGFVLNQTGYAEKMADVWRLVADETSRYARGGR